MQQIALRHARDCTANHLSVGGETLDRGYTDFDAWIPYLGPLGCKRIRLQSGWARCEASAGNFDFGWLDHIVNGVLEQSVRPWINLCYHNPLYGGGLELGSRLPSTPEALQAWLRYVTALVTHMQDRVLEWEIWNEPNNDPAFNTPDRYAEVVDQTARVIRRLQPGAVIYAGALAHVPLAYAEDLMVQLARRGALQNLDCITYHPYCPNPDDSRTEAAALRAVIYRFEPRLRIMQGETGAPSERRRTKALANFDWSERTQAIYALRQLVGDLACGIVSSIFSISDLHYPDEVNRKGLLLTDPSRRIIRPKLAYRAVQHVASLFDAQTRFESLGSDDSRLRAYRFDLPSMAGIVCWAVTELPPGHNRPLTDHGPALNLPAGARVYSLIDLLDGSITPAPRDEHTPALGSVPAHPVVLELRP